MKIFLSSILVFIMLFTMIFNQNRAQPYDSSYSYNEEETYSYAEESIPQSTIESESTVFLQDYDEILYLKPDIEAPVTYVPEIVAGDFYLDGYTLTFAYDIGEISGKASVPLSYGKLIDYLRAPSNDKFENTFVTNVSLAFHYDRGNASLTVNWKGGGYKSTDTFLFDSAKNFWYFKQENSSLCPVLLQDEDFTRIFPEETNDPYKGNTTFFCTETIYDVNFYQVTSTEMPYGTFSYGPNRLLAHFDEYNEETLFLWQEDVMAYLHLSIQYTDADGNEHLYFYSNFDGIGLDTAVMRNLEEPDWDTGAEGEVFVEEFYE